ncbi:MAG TPA: precorrin-8X methylmutase [Leucothrix mucor]|nr:precorrin-8X methylmutase [Leucothrix mucor]
MINFERCPKRIQQRSFEIVRELVDLEQFSEVEKQIAVRMIYACGDPSIIDDLRFSTGAAEAGLKSLNEQKQLICDVNLVISALNKKLLPHSPVCLINDKKVIAQAKQHAHTRSMVAVDYWHEVIADSIVLIGNAPTALFRLMELLEKDEINKPALIIAVPVGYTGAAESKQYLWDHQQALDVPCITLLGTRGSSALAATAMNALLSYQHGVTF